MTNAMNDDVRALTGRLAEGCRDAGLDARILGGTDGVTVSSPGANSRLAETVRCFPDEKKQSMFWWSWGEAICPATDITQAVKAIAHVVTPPDRSR